jgi:lipoyl(octanoyl) transferase
VNGVLSENKPAVRLSETASRWNFIDTGFNTGKFNMEFDLQLVERCRIEGTPFIRFYRWKPYAISMGYNQSKFIQGHKIDSDKCAEDNIDIVQRPTGGRAVLHSEELTYSVAMKSDKPVQTLYKEISLALLEGLKLIDESNIELQQLSFTKETPDLLRLAKTGMYNLCFNTSIKNEINYRGKKLVGSAQRKFGDIVLQHGSVLIGEYHKNIVKYLAVDSKVKDRLKREMNEKTTCLNEITGREISYEETAPSLIRGFEKTLNMKLNS